MHEAKTIYTIEARQTKYCNWETFVANTSMGPIVGCPSEEEDVILQRLHILKVANKASCGNREYRAVKATTTFEVLDD